MVFLMLSKSTYMKKLLFTFVLGLVGMQLFSQNLTDAVRYSSLIPGGTARTMGVGGSFGAMGGDFGVLTINPAGIADFRTSDLSFSFSFNGGETTSTLAGSDPQATSHTNEPVLENVGIVFTSRPSGSSLLTSNLAIGLNQYNNFRQNFNYSGFTESSITDRFAQRANGISPDFLDPFEAGIAFEAGAIYDFDGDLNYETDIMDAEEVYKEQTVLRSGKINELSIAWAGKFKNNFNLGIGIGIPFISFEENKTYEERDLNDNIIAFEDLIFSEELATSGSGFNFKLGVGYTLDKKIRFGLAYQSPTYFNLDDNYENNISYSYTDSGGFQRLESRSPDGRFEYKLTTPSRLTGSIGAIINTSSIKGFLNLDAQYVDYTGNRFNFTDNNNDPGEVAYEREVNTSIDTELQSVINFNLGGEIAIDNFRARAGIGFVASPYALDGTSNYNNVYSVGGGFRGDSFYIDAAYQLRSFSEGYQPYRLIDESLNPVVNNEADISKIIFTVGFKI